MCQESSITIGSIILIMHHKIKDMETNAKLNSMNKLCVTVVVLTVVVGCGV